MGRLSSRDRPEQLPLYAAGGGIVLTDDFSTPDLSQNPGGTWTRVGGEVEGEPPTLGQFIERLGIRMTAHRVERNPNIEDDCDWAREASHWRCIFTRSEFRHGRLYSFFSAGRGFGDGPPGADTVLNSLMCDAQTVESEPDFDHWREMYCEGLSDGESHRQFIIVRDARTRLRAFLGDENYRELVEDVTVL